MKYIIGIDNGSQSSKVVIYDINGNIVSQGRKSLRNYELPKPGWVLHPDDDIWDSIQSAAQEAMKNFKGNVADIIGVGLCTIRCCRALMKSNGELAYPVLSWMDIRISQNYVHDNKDVAYVTTSSGYITHRLTGEKKDTAANYVGTWPIDYQTWNWIEDENEFSSFDIPRNMLFDLVMPSEELGKITSEASLKTGIPEGLPVFATSNDKAVEALGAGLTSGNKILLSLGTYICAMMQCEEFIDNPKNFWINFADIANKYICETNGIRRGMWTVSWVRDLVFDHNLVPLEQIGGSYEEFLNKEAEKVPAGSEGLLTLLDFLAPTNAQYKKGIFVGLDGRHGRAHMYRSVLEAIAMTMYIHSIDMSTELNKKFDTVIVTGGGSNSHLFMQIIADVFGVPSVKNEVNECASLGAAINCALGLGVYENVDVATAKMLRVEEHYYPNSSNHNLYKRVIDEVYRDLFSNNDQLLMKLHNIFN